MAEVNVIEKTWLSVEELSDRLDVPVSTIRRLRESRMGPRGVRIGKHLRFALADVIEWERQRREASA